MAAKKSNKTEHVLKLITKNEENSEDEELFVIDQDEATEPSDENPPPAAAEGEQPQETPAAAALPVSEVSFAESVQGSAPKQEREPNESPMLRAFREQESKGSVVATPPQSHDLVNIAEVLTREKLALVMERMKVCTCKTCMNDVLALALNSLPTKYVTTNAGRQYFQLDVYKKQNETDILAALTKACVRVKASPRHE